MHEADAGALFLITQMQVQDSMCCRFLNTHEVVCFSRVFSPSLRNKFKSPTNRLRLRHKTVAH